MSAGIARTEMGWVAIATNVKPDSPEWTEMWDIGERLVAYRICPEFDSVSDRYVNNPEATVDRLPVYDNPRMRDVLLATLARAETDPNRVAQPVYPLS